MPDSGSQARTSDNIFAKNCSRGRGPCMGTSPNPPVDGMRSHAAAEHAAMAAADCLSVLLCGSTPTTRRRTAAVLERMLWPTFGPAADGGRRRSAKRSVRPGG